MIEELEFTKASSKGQIVLPSNIRRKLGIQRGSVLSVVAKRDMVILKKMHSSLSSDDLKTLKLVEEAWEDIEKGRYKVRPKGEFFKELRKW